jgi:uncharacterized membrane protein
MKRFALVGILTLLISIVLIFMQDLSADYTYTRNSFHLDMKELKDSGRMSASEILTLTLYISRGELTGTSFEGKTYLQILRDAKAFEKHNHQNKLRS